MYEHGPFKLFLEDDGTSRGNGTVTASAGSIDADSGSAGVRVELNPFSWSRAATMIYVDSPAGTGMSYSEHTSDYNTSDTRTVGDLLTFMQRFYEAFPHLARNDLYAAGESYAGVYVPLLADAIMQHNAAAAARASGDGGLLDGISRQQNGVRSSAQPSRRLLAADAVGAAVIASQSATQTQPAAASSKTDGSRSADAAINLVGYLVGNGVTDDEYDGNAQVGRRRWPVCPCTLVSHATQVYLLDFHRVTDSHSRTLRSCMHG